MSYAAAINIISPLQKTEETGDQATVSHRSGFFGSLKVIPLIPPIISPWQPSEYIRIAHAIEAILRNIKPDLVVIDNILFHAADAADKFELPYIILSPSAWKDMASHEQGLKTFMLPMMGSGWSYPLPLHLIPLNFILVLYFIYNLFTNPQLKAVFAARNEAGYTRSFFPTPDKLRLCMGIPHLEFPIYRPKNVISIGPMLLPSSPLASVDPETDEWLNHPEAKGMFTISFALGSLTRLDKAQARGLLRMFEELILEREDIRVYAKVMRMGTYELPVVQEIEERLGKHRIKVVEWMKADPVVLLWTGKVDLAIHHAGSSSYYEALSLGLPQVAVSSWLDCYDFAVRIEQLGIGKWGNREAGPGFIPSELLSTIHSVLAGYSKIKVHAIECADIAAMAGTDVKSHDEGKLDLPPRESGVGVEGRDVAAEWILRKAKTYII